MAGLGSLLVYCAIFTALGVSSLGHFHVLKQPIATYLLDAGADLRFVQDWISHASIRNTIVYEQLTSHRREE
jgi:site-specific recombinase XerD